MWLIGSDLGLNSWLVAADCVYKQGETPDDFQAHDWLKIGFNSTDINVLNQMHDKLSQFEGLELTNSLPTNIEVNRSEERRVGKECRYRRSAAPGKKK